MRRSSIIILALIVVLVTALTGLMMYVTVRYTATEETDSDVAASATLPSPAVSPHSEPDNVVVRLVFILSVLVVFVSAVLVLFRLINKVPFRD